MKQFPWKYYGNIVDTLFLSLSVHADKIMFKGSTFIVIVVAVVVVVAVVEAAGFDGITDMIILKYLERKKNILKHCYQSYNSIESNKKGSSRHTNLMFI